MPTWTFFLACLATRCVLRLRGEFGFVCDLCVGSAFLLRSASRMVFSQSNSTSDFHEKSLHGTQSFQKFQKISPHGMRGFPGALCCASAGGSVAGVGAWCKFMSETVREVHFVLQKYVKFDLAGFGTHILGVLIPSGFSCSLLDSGRVTV